MTTFDASKRGTIERDVTYAVMEGTTLKMDVYYPKTRGPWRVLVFVHGGGWTEGDKAPLPVVPPGFLVVSINYRMYPDHRFPAMIEDLKCAIRFLRLHARRYNLDPERIALLGHSAGGHLAALAGLSDERAGWDVGPYLEHSSRVQAVVALSAPTDLRRSFPDWVTELKAGVFGEQHLESSSPVTHARKEAPPFLIVHGEADAVVPVEQAQLLYEALVNTGARAQKIIVQHAGHGFEAAGGKVRPSMKVIIARVLLFLAWHLR